MAVRRKFAIEITFDVMQFFVRPRYFNLHGCKSSIGKGKKMQYYESEWFCLRLNFQANKDFGRMKAFVNIVWGLTNQQKTRCKLTIKEKALRLQNVPVQIS